MLIEDIIPKKVTESPEHVSATNAGVYDRNLANVLDKAEQSGDAEWVQAVKDRMTQTGYEPPKPKASPDKVKYDRARNFVRELEMNVGDLIGDNENDVPGAYDAIQLTFMHKGIPYMEKMFDYAEQNERLIRKVLKKEYGFDGDLSDLIASWHRRYWADHNADLQHQ